MGSVANFIPFQAFGRAIKYGLNNARLYEQFILNIVMFMPLGFLLPIVFDKMRNWLKVFIVSFSITLLTEIMQLVTQRGSDVDDLIANTLGGLLGYFIFILMVLVIRKVRKSDIHIQSIKTQFVFGCVITLLTLSPFIAVNIIDTNSPYGNLYYGHLQPNNIIISDNISKQSSTGSVYQNQEALADIPTIQETLLKATNSTGVFEETPSGYSYENENGLDIYIRESGSYRVYFPTQNKDVLLSKNELIDLAWNTLDHFDISNEIPILNEFLSEENSNGEWTFIFTTSIENDDTLIYGDIEILVDNKGNLISLRNNQMQYTFYEEVSLISPYDSIGIALDIGVGDWNGTATVSNVVSTYTFIEDTGFLIPTYQIQATFESLSEDKYLWSPVIDATE